MSRKAFVALLRGINVGGHNKVPMADLRKLCGELGGRDVKTWIQSGNVVFRAAAEPVELESALERGIERRLGFSVPAIVREASEWPALVAGNPFPEAARDQPNLVMLALSKTTPAPGTVEALRERAAASERVERVGDALFLHYPNGSARSRLTGAALDRASGSPVTTRNWRTVLKLEEMARAASEG